MELTNHEKNNNLKPSSWARWSQFNPGLRQRPRREGDDRRRAGVRR
ncbi:MAG: hypothetical protein ACLT98_06950 [Eggerthellaceae bacterium]